MHTSNVYEQLTKNYLAVLKALPHPLALFRAADGRLLTANHQFFSDFGLPVEKDRQEAGTETVGFPAVLDRTAEETDLPYLHVTDQAHIRFKTKNGLGSPLQAEVHPVRYQGEDCWLLTRTAGAEDDKPGMGANNHSQNYRELVENLNDIVYATDTNAVVTYISPNVFQLSGYTPEEVIGKNFTEFVHPEDLPGRIEQFLKILGGSKEVTEYRYFTKAGEMKWARTSARPIRRNGQVFGIQGVLVDITDRKAVEEALKRSEEKYRILVQHAKDAIFVVQDEQIRFMNPVASEILGYTCDRIADRPFIEFVHPDDRELIMDRYRRRMQGGDLSDRVSFRIINKDGESRDVDLNAVLITWEEKPAILNFLRDITLQKMMEAQLRNSQRMEALGTLAGGIAHNFNNLLMGILGNMSLSQKGLDPSSQTFKYLEKINKLVKGGSKLTHQLLEYARGGSCEVGVVDLNQLVKDTSETVVATKKKIRIHHKMSETIPCLTADQGQIEQVLLNLLLNAADAMPNGGDIFVETSCLAAGQAADISELSPRMAYVLLKVTDCGTGMPKAIQDRIFEPFFTTKGLDRGTGLGLSTAYGIVKNHNGKIHVESEINKGSSFFVYLPAAADDASQSAGYNISGEVPDKGPK